MIESVQLQNFISHSDTTLKLDDGLTLFIGHNGSGKSSVIDAITFALYGKHTRNNNKNLVKQGSNSSLVQVEMSVKGRKFTIIRALNASGQLINAKLIEHKPGGPVNIVTGERKQFSESVADEISEILGLDYSKLKIAAVVQQGELNAIIQAQPREFKELINSLFGLDRLDLAYQAMKDIIQNFRAELRKMIGHDDSEISNVKERLEGVKKMYDEAHTVLNGLEEEKRYLQNKRIELENFVKEQEPLLLKINELESKQTELLIYIKNERKKMEKDVSEKTKLVNYARKYLLIVKDKSEVELKLEELRKALSEADTKLENISNDIGRINALIEVGDKLQIVDGKCPVCKSPVRKVEEIYSVTHLKNELDKLMTLQKQLTIKKQSLKSEEKEYRKKELEISNAEAFLENNAIGNMDHVKALENEISDKVKALEKIPTAVNNIEKLAPIAIDDYSNHLVQEILRLQKETTGFDLSRYEQIRTEYRRLLTEDLPDLEAEIGEYKAKLEQAKDDYSTLEIAIKELEKAGEYMKIFEKIRNLVYNRDGIVGMSLRTWALKTISQKASEYTAMFNMSISRLQLTEKARDISIECYGKSGVIDMESLSGGEKVAIALALRLGIAYVMGSGKLDFVILDEPTTHLDEERRKSLVRIITEAFRSGLGPLSQMILITHDSEIFEDAEVDTVYRFTITNEGTLVTRI
ncbi:MAG: SMC family ATPase [Nitrososphaerales archaeon]